MVAERKYAMMRLRRGDYLLPSNDGETLWRIYQYEEDGSLDGWKGMFWACCRRPFPQDHELDELLEWYGWEFWSGPWRKRSEAVAEALR